MAGRAFSKPETGGYAVLFRNTVEESQCVFVASLREFPGEEPSSFWDGPDLDRITIVARFDSAVLAEDFVRDLGDHPRVELLTRWADSQMR